MRSRTTAALGSITAEHRRAGARRLREGMTGVFGEADRGRLSGLTRSAGLDGGEVSPLRPRLREISTNPAQIKASQCEREFNTAGRPYPVWYNYYRALAGQPTSHAITRMTVAT